MLQNFPRLAFITSALTITAAPAAVPHLLTNVTEMRCEDHKNHGDYNSAAYLRVPLRRVFLILR